MNIKELINKYWLIFIIVTQPILDIIAFFSFDEFLTPFSFAIRSFYLLFIVLYTFIKCKNKKKYILSMLPIGIFSILHLSNTIRISGFNIFDDLRYLILVMQFPILTISLCLYINENKKEVNNIRKGFPITLIIIFASVLLSIITNSYITTYEDYGITGWFTSPNTQSMILSAIIPFSIYYFYKKDKFHYIISLIISFILLFFNATRACYYTLVSVGMVFVWISITQKSKDKIKIITSIIFLVLSISLYGFSFTELKTDESINNANNNQEIVENYDNLSKEEVIDVLKSSYIYEEMIDDFGEDRVYEEMKDKITPFSLTDNRLVKKTYAKFVFEDSDFLTKLVGINHYDIEKYEKDLENDLTAIFYYYGYIGFTLYIMFILYFIFLGIKMFLKNPKIIFNGDFIILSYSIALLLYGSEFSGAFLRKSNANIYIILIFVMYYYIYKKGVQKKMKENKLTFLLLHLGYGGIETSTINTANALCDKFEIELISFYKLSNNQSNKIDERIKVKYLYNGEPNKDEFINSIKERKYFKTFKEGLKAIDILLKKKYLLIKNIIDCDSKYIVSTRWDFSILLSKYGNKKTVKIAQEHHYHNNDKKYINVLKNKYKNIDYLFALTKTLEEDYKEILKKNKHTKIKLVPNMLFDIPNVKSDLNSKNLITVSRLDYGKKNDDIIKAFSKINDKSWNLYIIGDGKEFDNLNNLVNELKLEKKVFLTGYKNKKEIEEYMIKSSLFLMASLTEGLPMVLLEAMSYGIPCIAYETASGVLDIINNNSNGYVIKNRNEKEYVEKINKLIKDEKLRKKMGDNAKKKVDNFSKTEIVKIWLSILK